MCVALSEKWKTLSSQSLPRRFFDHAKHAEAIADISNGIKQALDCLGVCDNMQCKLYGMSDVCAAKIARGRYRARKDRGRNAKKYDGDKHHCKRDEGHRG